jgi:hypothetical protein
VRLRFGKVGHRMSSFQHWSIASIAGLGDTEHRYMAWRNVPVGRVTRNSLLLAPCAPESESVDGPLILHE